MLLLIRLLYNIYFIFRCRYLITKKTNSENVSTLKVGVLYVEFALKLRIKNVEIYIILKNGSWDIYLLFNVSIFCR